MTDPITIEESRKGNIGSFRKLIQDTSPFVYNVALRMVGQRELAKDIVQETMISVWQNLDKIKSAAAYKKWVYRIVLNKCYDDLRQRKRNHEITADDKTWAIIAGKIADDGMTNLDNEESIKIINLLTSQLSPKQKAVFVLSELEDLSHEEICSITGLSRNTVKSNLYHARQNITVLLEKYI